MVVEDVDESSVTELAVLVVDDVLDSDSELGVDEPEFEITEGSWEVLMVDGV